MSRSENRRHMLFRDEIDAAMLAAAPNDALDIIEHLTQAGYDAYLVGGCVRDTLEGASPHDWDITTSATPEQMKEAVPYRSIDTGLQHGTITFMVGGEPYETTVFRTDGEYSDGRHPDSVEFASTVEADLARRDFTVNAMAWSPSRGLVDPYDGFGDLEKNQLRGVGEPKKRFEEDGLRVMRAVRFASTHGYDIEENTARAMHETLPMLDAVSAERVTSEFMKTMGAADGQHMADIFSEFRDVMFKAVPELSALDEMEDQDNSNHDRTLLQHSLDTMAKLPAYPLLRLAGLVHDIGKPSTKTEGEDGQSHYYGHMDAGRDIVEAMCVRMKMSNEESARLAFLVGNHDNRPRETEKSARRFLVKMGTDEMLSDMLALMEADISTHSPDAVERVMPRFRKACSLIEQEHEKSLAMKVSDLAVNGNVLMDMGYAPGPALGAALNEMFSLVVDGEMENDEETLRAYAEKVKEELDLGKRVLSKNRKTFTRPDGAPCERDIADVKADSTDTPKDEFECDDGTAAVNAATNPATTAGASIGAAGGAPANPSGHKRSSGSRSRGRSRGDGKVYVSPHVRGGVKVSGYYRSSPGRRK